MSTLVSTGKLGLLEMANRTKNGDLMTIVEVLNKDNPILQNTPVEEANDQFSHAYLQRLSLPTGSTRGLNEGYAVSATTTRRLSTPLMMVGDRSEVDKKYIDSMPNPKKARMDESRGKIEGLSQTWASKVFYGNQATDSKEFNGLANILNATSMQMVYDAGGTGSDTTSIYIVQPGLDKFHFVYPRGSKSLGVEHLDLGVESVVDPVTSTKKLVCYVDQFEILTGLCIKHDRCVARIANIETTGSTNIFNENLLIEALNRMVNGGKGAIIYCNSTIKTQMDIALKDKNNVNFTAGGGDGLGGEDVVRFKQRPVYQCDAILDTETAIS